MVRIRFSLILLLTALLILPARAQQQVNGEVTDSHGIIVTPAEGTHKYYKRTGTALYYQSGQMNSIAQDGILETVELEDGTIYFRDFLSQAHLNTWVKGTKEGNTITIPQRQTIYYDTDMEYSILLGWATYDINNADPWTAVDAGNITLTVSGDGTTLSVDGTGVPGMGYNMIAALYAHNGGFAGYGDYETVLTLDADFQEPDLVQLPAGAEVLTWHKQSSRYSGSAGWSNANGTVRVAFVEGKVYVSGLFANYPNSWIEGTISGSTVTFASPQYVGSYSTTYMYVMGSTGYRAFDTFQDFTMTYDTNEKVLKSDADQWLLVNASLERINYLEAYTDITLQENTFSEPLIETGEAVETLPYIYDFNGVTTDNSTFGIYDANGDHCTWSYDGEAACYTANNRQQGNDWLVSPAIRLEAGKIYCISFQTKNSSSTWTERVEVKMAREPRESAFTTQVIEPTDVTWYDYQTLENNMFSVDETGYYHFGIHAISDEAKYKLYVQRFSIDGETSMTAPQVVTDLTAVPDAGARQIVLSFTAPSKDIKGDALESSMTVSILRDGNQVGELTDVAPGSIQQFTDSEGLTEGEHTYQVVATNASGSSRMSEAVTVTLSPCIELPVHYDFLQAGTLDNFLIIDANGDGNTWCWSEAYGDYGVRYPLNIDNDADDYMVTGAIHMVTGKNYRVRLKANCIEADYPETFEVLMGRQATPAGLSMTVIEPTSVSNEEPIEYEGETQVAEEGYYYVAIHAISKADMWDLCVTELTIEEGADANAPAKPVLTATAGDEGALEVSVSVTAPTQTVGGASISGTMTLDILRDGELLSTINAITPGETTTWKDTQVADGKSYGYQVVATNGAGSSPKSSRVSVYVGLDTPAAVTEAPSVVLDGDNIHLSWGAVSDKGVHEGYVNPAQVTYEIWTATLDDSWGQIWWDLNEKLAEVEAQTTATIQYSPKDQTKQYFAVRAVNTAGEGEAAYTAPVLVGQSYKLPFYESFEGGQLHYYWDFNGTLMTTTEAADDDKWAVEMLSADAGAGWLHSGKIDIQHTTAPTLYFDVKSNNIASLDVLVSKDGGAMEVVKTISLSADYSHVSVPLTEWKNCRFLQIGFQALYTEPSEFDENGNVVQKGDLITLDAIRIADAKEGDLALVLNARSTVKAGQTATITATVTNNSGSTIDDYEVIITIDGENFNSSTLQSSNSSEPLSPYASRDFTILMPTTVFDATAVREIVATVICSSDPDQDNNTAQALLSVIEPTVAPPRQLEAFTSQTGEAWGFTWLAPVQQAQEVTETFEDQEAFPAFSLGGITETKHTGAFDDWTLYDGNGINVYRISGLVVPNSSKPAAWQVCRPSELLEVATNAFIPHSGEQFLWSFCPSENGNHPATDHWLISPPLSGNAQTVSLYARCITNNYYAPETFEVLASSTGTNPEDFTVVATLSTISLEWTPFTADLPDGTKYFAIRHTSEDVFGLLVDDIHYEAGDGDVACYKLYYHRNLVATVSADTTTYTSDIPLEGTDEAYAVTAVYASGQESSPVTVNTTDGVSHPALGEASWLGGCPMEVYSVDGRLVRSKAKSLEGLKRGVYIINGKTVMVR